MNKIIILFFICSSLLFSQGVRSINGSMNNSQQIVWDTTGTPNIFKITSLNGVHTLWFPYSRYYKQSDNISVGTISSGAITSTGKSQLDSLTVVGKIYANGIPSDSTGLPTGALYFRPADGIIRRKY